MPGFILRPEIARMVSEREVKNRALAYSLRCIESRDPRVMVEGISLFLWEPDHRQRCHFAKGGTMEHQRIEELRAELDLLLTKQTQVLELRTFGGASDADILEYEIRQEVILEICTQLANSAAA
jgi:hypothetical protein